MPFFRLHVEGPALGQFEHFEDPIAADHAEEIWVVSPALGQLRRARPSGSRARIAYAQRVPSPGGRSSRKELGSSTYERRETISLRLRFIVATGAAVTLWALIGLSIWSLAA